MRLQPRPSGRGSLPDYTYTNKLTDPIRKFNRWFDAAAKAGIKEPNAMTLATATRDGKPSARMVLLKGVDHGGFVFFTNYESRKGRELAQNARAALVFYWEPLGRQVRVTGRVSRVTAKESDEYFATRHLGSRYSASASNQSRVIASRAVLERKLARLKEKYRDDGPPRPIHWGGFRVQPDEIEFWQAGEFRLHDRVRYRRRGSSWVMDRLSP
ncbi:MAG: pyridoxamine 5'-phosphate oxidase [Acidobacteriia bacterium]|nr:pyridoxamine 5'-phosphate oxidase [Terriglobia bacterium]